jgi:hypothetical protein
VCGADGGDAGVKHPVDHPRTTPNVVPLKPMKPRAEAKIRADFEMQILDIIGNFERQVELDRAREPL